jgi:hypothetical protein
MAIAQFLCQQCGAALPMDSIEAGTCPYCHTSFLPPQGVCPKCRHLNADEDTHCAHCGADLLEGCPECGHSNRTGVKCCVGCGADLTAAWRMAMGFQQAYAHQRIELQQKTEALRLQEEEQSRHRIQALEDKDEILFQDEYQRMEEKQRRDAALQIVVGFAFVVFIALVIAVIAVGSIK